MSKEKVNPGENCPFCKNTTNPGSTVCVSCGATRVLGLAGEAKRLVTLSQFVLIPAFIISALCGVFVGSDHSGIALLSFVISGLCFYGGIRFEKSQKEYIWQRKE